MGREPIKLNNQIVQKEIKGNTILITGAAGSIGSELARQVAKYKYKNLILLDIAESPLYDIQQELIRKGKSRFRVEVADIRDSLRIHQIFDEFKPDLVFHAAAYKHVPLMEDVPYEAVATNVFGTYTLANLSINHKVKKFVMVSTDKAVNPTNVMGATKRLSEMYVSSLKDNNTTKFITTRFGNVLGSNGSVIPLFRKQMAQIDEVDAIFIDDPKSRMFKYWARSDTVNCQAKKGFALIVHTYTDTNDIVISTDPNTPYFLPFLGQVIEIEEAAARWKNTGSDTRITSSSGALDECQNFNPDPWSNGRSYDYTLIKSPNGKTVLASEDIRKIIKDLYKKFVP